MEQTNYGQCKFCGADNVKNPKTGKIFCKEKCWLKQENPQTPKQPYRKYPLPNDKDDEYWKKIRAENAEGQSLGNAKNCAAMLLSAAMRKGELTLSDALSKFDEVVQWVYDVGNEKTS